MNKVLKNIASAFMGIMIAANAAAVPAFAEGEEVTSTIIVTENYNHYMDGLDSNHVVKTDYDYVACMGYVHRVTFVNFKLPQIDTSKIKSVKYVLTTKAIGTEQAELDIAGIYVPHTEWLTSAGTTTGGSGTATNSEIAYNKALEYYDAAVGAGDPITVADLEVDKETAVDVTDFIKGRIDSGNDGIDMLVRAYSQTTKFYSRTESVEKAPRLEFEIDCTNADTELSALSEAELKGFVNTYSAYYGVDYNEINKYNDISDIYDRLIKINGWNTHDGFKAAFEAAVNSISVKAIETKETDNMYFNANNGARNITLNENTIVNVGNNRRKGLIGFAIPDIDVQLIKSVKMVAVPSATPTADTNISIRAHGELDSSLFTAGTTEDNFLAMEKILEESCNVIGAGAYFNVSASSQEVAVTADITDYIKEYMQSGKNKIYFSFSQPWNIGAFTIYTGTSANAIKLVYEVRDDIIESEFLAINNAAELNAFLLTDKPAALGISNEEYSIFAYPEYIVERIIDIGYTDVASFKEAFETAVNEFKITITIDSSGLLHYRTPEYWRDYWQDSDGNLVDNGVKKGLVSHQVGSGGTSPAYAAVFFTFELPNGFKALSGTAKMNKNGTNDNQRSVKSRGYTDKRVTVPEPGLYEIGSDIANAWFSYADILTDSPSTFTADNSMAFTFEANSTEASVDISAGMLNTLNAAAGDEGSRFLTLSLNQGDNIVVNKLTLELVTDGTLAKKASEDREAELLSAVNNQSDADTVLLIFNDFDDILKLSSNEDYQKVNKTAVAQAVINGIGDGYVSVEALLTAINEAVAALPKLPFTITGVTNENNTVSVSVKKNSEAGSAVITAAAYKGGSLTGVKTVTSAELNNAEAGADAITVNIENAAFDADASIKVFIWESMSSMKALAEAFVK